MKRHTTRGKTTKAKATGTKIGREAFATITAVEGLELTPAMKRRAAEFDRKGLSTEERVRAVIAVHRKG
jgi:ribosomal protein L18